MALQITFAGKGFTFEKPGGDPECVSSSKDSLKSQCRSLLYRKPVRDCKEIKAHPVPGTCAGSHMPSPCWSFVQDGNLERCVSANSTEPCFGGLELARAASHGLQLTHLLGCGIAALPGPGENGTAALLMQHTFSVA